MERTIIVELTLDTESESEAYDAINEMLRPHMPEHASGDTQSALIDYNIL
jgi:hypothetical protein